MLSFGHKAVILSLSKLPSKKVLLKLEFDTEDQVLFDSMFSFKSDEITAKLLLFIRH